MKSGPLSGLRVIEVGEHVSAPYFGFLFASLGADVVKIECPPDPARERAIFPWLNAGKRSAVIDLTSNGGRERFNTLLSVADVLVENLQPGDPRLDSLDGQALSDAHPRLVAVSLSCYGRFGPDAKARGYGLQSQAESATAIVLGNPDRSPIPLPFDTGEFELALHGASATLAALHERSLSGRGQAIDLSGLEVAAFLSSGMAMAIGGAFKGWRRRKQGRGGRLWPNGAYPARDGEIMMISQTAREWRKLRRTMGEPEWSNEARFADASKMSIEDQAAADVHLEAWLGEKTRAEIHRIALENNLVLAPLNRPEELLEDDHYRFHGFFHDVESGGRAVRAPGLPLVFSETPGSNGGKFPVPGAHTEEVLREASREAKSRAPGSDSAPDVSRDGSGPLSGIRVVDFGWNWAGPMVTQALADLGAEVIKIETKKRQDLMRFIKIFNPFFRQINRGKKSVTIDIKNPAGLELVRRLAAKSDILIENFAAGVMARNGLAYSDLASVNPRLIYVAMSMAGEEGPKRAMRGFAAVATAYGGLEAVTGYPDRRTGLIYLGHGDVNASAFALVAALSALAARDRTGRGQLIDVSQIEAVTAILGEPIVEYQLTGEASACVGAGHLFFRPHGIFPAADEDAWVAIACGSDTEREALEEATGATDEAALERWTRERTREAICGVLREAGIAVAPVLGMEEKDAHPHLAARGHIAPPIESKGAADWGAGKLYTLPWHFSRTPAQIYGDAPALGEHNADILGGLLGLDREEIERLTKEGAIA